MKKLSIISCAIIILGSVSLAYAKQVGQQTVTLEPDGVQAQTSSSANINKASSNSQGNSSSNSSGSQDQDRDQTQDQVRDQDRNGDCDGDGIINSQDVSNDETINACKQYENRIRWAHSYNARSETAQMHMSVVAQAVEGLLQLGDKTSDKTLGEQIREIAQQHGQSAEKIIEEEDKLNQRSGVLKFFVGSDLASVDEINQQMEQIRNQVRELNQIRTQLQNEGDQTELQNQIKILELQLTNFQNSLDAQESTFSLFGWLLKLFR